ncbi:Hpr(Ser) kinase/phosphatase [Enhydrobacter aerosaccus]|uniref:Hpr(Ser) kinase/phosphatase n=1 Tax=Enhydrobacter aerosaccus TaxID=225324 RepID=A0A1T4SVH4_9HYPH|nr:HPr kinase/phosphatase C-terminal domain-containing protein [Enhydrobacter aerosaccus]SKA32159.1 Hpr(Ser) kinase/phosphatase [Enhydrobacter aerosaccus]
MFVHATCVALRTTDRPWRAVLLRGPSGAGKSDLALRLLDSGGRLIADDQTHLARRGRKLIATPPPALAGRIEVRGLGIVDLPRNQRMAQAAVGLIVDLVPPSQIERMPDPTEEALLGLTLPLFALTPFEASAVTKLYLALARTPAA